MTTPRSTLRFALLAAGLLGLAARLPAQNTPRPVVSTRPNEPVKGPLQGKTTNVVLRPNADLTFHAYLENPGQQAWTNVTVRLTADEKGEQPLAEGLVEQVGAGEVARVVLRSLAPPEPPAAPMPPAGDKEKAPPAAPKPPAGAPAPAALYLHALDDQKKPFPNTRPTKFEVRVSAPRDYVSATPQVTPTGGGFALTVRLAPLAGAGEVFRGKPAPARLVVRPELIPGLDPASLKDGTYQTVIAPNTGEVALVAKNLRFTGRPGPSVVTVSVDGYDRAFVFATDFSGTTPALTPSNARLVRVDAPRYAVPGRPLAVRLEVFNDRSDASAVDRPRLEFQRAEQGDPEVPTADLTTPRQQTITYRVGQAGELIFHAGVKDWEIPLDTAGVYGTRTLTFSLTDQAGKVLTRPRADDPTATEPVTTTHTLTLDDTVPADVRLLALPPKVVPKKPRKQPPPPGAVPPLPGPNPVPGLVLPPWACDCVLPPSFGVPAPPPATAAPKELPPPLPLVIGKTRVRGTVLELVARAEDPESGVAAVLFFVGAPPGPDGKSPPGSKAAVGELAYRPLKAKETGPPEVLGYAAAFDLPDAKGPLTVGVRVTNGAGLTTEVTHDLLLVDPPPPPTTGTIEGRVVQGSTPERPQPGLDVLLTDPAGKVIKATKADAAGAFAFEELPPGPYAVMSVKVADFGAKAIQPATVEAGEVTTVTLELKR